MGNLKSSDLCAVGSYGIPTLTDTEKEAGIASDANGIPCTFGPNHDGCKDKIADDGTDVSNFPKLPLGQHYGICEEDIHHELGCGVVNDGRVTKSGGESEMNMLLGAVVILIIMIGAQSVYAVPAFQSGFNYEVQDASLPPNIIHGFGGDPSYYGAYINQTGKGLDHHSDAFVEGL